MAKKVIPLYVERLEVLDKLTDEQSGKLFKAIYYYSVRQEENLNALLDDGMTDILFSCFKGSLDLADEHYERVCEKRRAAGIRGSQVRWGKEPQEKSCGTVVEDSIANDSKCYQMPSNDSKQWQTMASVANTNTNTNTKTNTKDISSKDDLSTCVDADHIDYNVIMDYWNEKTGGVMGSVRSIDGTRRTMVRARIKQYGLEEFFRMIDMAAKSDYMHDKQWANFGWCIKPNNFIKVLEGAYITRNNNGTITTELPGGIEIIRPTQGNGSNGQNRYVSESEKRRAERDALESML